MIIAMSQLKYFLFSQERGPQNGHKWKLELWSDDWLAGPKPGIQQGLMKIKDWKGKIPYTNPQNKLRKVNNILDYFL